MKNKQKAKFSFGAYLSFFTRFPIPWWLFLLSLLLGFANTEVVLAVSNYLIRINKGELYNGVIIGYRRLLFSHWVRDSGGALAVVSSLCRSSACTPKISANVW